MHTLNKIAVLLICCEPCLSHTLCMDEAWCWYIFNIQGYTRFFNVNRVYILLCECNLCEFILYDEFCTDYENPRCSTHLKVYLKPRTHKIIILLCSKAVEKSYKILHFWKYRSMLSCKMNQNVHRLLLYWHWMNITRKVHKTV